MLRGQKIKKNQKNSTGANSDRKGAGTLMGMVKQAFCFTCNNWTFYIENAFTYHLYNLKNFLIIIIIIFCQKKKKKMRERTSIRPDSGTDCLDLNPASTT